MNKLSIFEQIEENIPAIIYKLVIKDSGDYKVEYLSKAIYEIFKIDQNQLPFNFGNIINLIDKEEVPYFMDSLQNAFNINSKWEWKGKVTINNVTKIMMTYAKPDISSLNEKAWIGLAFDITENETLRKEVEEKKEKFNAIAYNFPGIVYEWYINKKTGETGFNYVSDKTRDILGIEPYQINDIYSMHDPLDVETIIKDSKEQMINPKDWIYEYKVTLKDGSSKWLKYISKPEKNNDEILTYNGIILDITSEKNYELLIKERQNIILETQKMAKIGSWEFNLSNKQLIWTEEMFRIFDIDISEKNLLSEYFSRIHPDDKQYVSYIISNPIFEDDVKNIEYKIYSKNKQLKYLFATMRAVKNSDGKAYKFWGTTQDITELKNKEFELIKAKNEAIQASKAKSEFLSNMSHELRTPINAVIGITNILLQEKPREDQLENLNLLKFSSKNLLTIVNDILDFSKIEAGKIVFEDTSFSIRDLINNIKSVFLTIANDKNITLKLNIASDIPDLLIGDPTRLSQIINNLVSNAIKFTEKGTVEINVFLKEIKNKNYTLIFFVSDTGIGIPENKIKHIFESFTQASSETNRKFGGTGLGLTITKRLIDLQNGNLNVKSEVGKGSVFSFTLKFKKSENNIKSHIKELTSNNLNGLKVLLVEDNKINTAIALQFLKKWEAIADTAVNGIYAVEKVKNNIYDIILMDLQMPEMDGYEAAKSIRQIDGEYYKKVPIIALTASATIDIKQKCKDSGINDFISKPFEPSDLLQKLSNYKK